MLRSKMVDNQRTKPALKSQNQPIKRKADAKKAKIEIIEEKPQVQEMSFDCPMDVSMSSLKSEDEVDEKVLYSFVEEAFNGVQVTRSDQESRRVRQQRRRKWRSLCERDL
jgi:hypothetical protein